MTKKSEGFYVRIYLQGQNQDVINVVFSFQADWLKKWREFSRPIIERRIAETWQSRITFDTRLTSLTPWRDYYLISPYNITLESHIKVTRIKKKRSPTKEALDCLTNSPCQHLNKYTENSMENMHADLRV